MLLNAKFGQFGDQQLDTSLQLEHRMGLNAWLFAGASGFPLSGGEGGANVRIPRGDSLNCLQQIIQIRPLQDIAGSAGIHRL